MKQLIPLNDALFYGFLFASTTLFYTLAYLGEIDEKNMNLRSEWYIVNRNKIIFTQFILLAFCILFLVYYSLLYFKSILQIPAWQWLLEILFGLVAFLYYGFPLKKFNHINLRKKGWLKAFVIGFVWAGMVNFTPILFYQIENDINYKFSTTNLLLFINNFMFVSVIAILFDIKDFNADHNKQLKTFVVIHGLRKTIFYIVIPLSVIGLISLLQYAILSHENIASIFFNSIPFLLLLVTAWSLRKRKSILFYLAIIDGLLLLKAFCGMAGMIL